MRVLFQSRSTLFSVPGGDTVQLTKTAAALRKLGVDVDISTELSPNLSKYDVVHAFNLMRPQEVYIQAMNAKSQNKPFVLSTIYGLYTEYEKAARPGFAGFVGRTLPMWQVERLKVLARVFANREFGKGALLVALKGYYQCCNDVVRLTDVFLPNSDSEMMRVHSDFPVSKEKPYFVVPNAVDNEVFNLDNVKISDDVKRFSGCVLSVARIEGRKCQLELVRAVKGMDVDLVIVGRPAPNHLDYYEQVRQEADDRVHFIGQTTHEKLAEYYAAADVHALVSWMETPGLSSLEAGVMGCNLVITHKGDTYDYFGDHAFYCDPGDVSSIRLAVEKALAAPKDQSLMEMIRDDYNWGAAASMTLEGYSAALDMRS